MTWSVYPSPIGDLLLGVRDGALFRVRLGARPSHDVARRPSGTDAPGLPRQPSGTAAPGDPEPAGPARRPRGSSRSDDDRLLDVVRAQLDGYFAGTLTEFTVPLALHGSDFERRVWQVLQEIPYGETCSYGAVARAVGDPDAARAVGVANNRNPVPVIVPCHRVIGANGKLVGYGGGLDRKRILLELEARVTIERDFAL